ncbi:hypothetical protein Bbelb_234900 [Branchiostoma belcheri]|nr:hypothetical protein Bbelb_234900 [Branchiostoma belcheri]
MGGCPAIRPKCRRPSLTGDTSERARLGVRASTTALRRRGKDGRTGDTSERARLEVRASTTALRRRGKDGRTGDTSERSRLEVRASTTALRRRGKDGRVPDIEYGPHRRPSAGGTGTTFLERSRTGVLFGAPSGKLLTRRSNSAGGTSEGTRRFRPRVGGRLRPGTHRRGPDLKYGPQRRPCAGGEKMGGCPAIRPKCRRSSLTGDTSERARLEVRASTTALRRRGKDGRGPTWSTGLNDGLAPAGKRWEGARRLGLSVDGHLRPGTHRRGPDLKYGPQRRPCAGGEKMGGCPAIRPKCRRSSQTGDTSERARLEVRASTTALRRRGKDGRVPGD